MDISRYIESAESTYICLMEDDKESIRESVDKYLDSEYEIEDMKLSELQGFHKTHTSPYNNAKEEGLKEGLDKGYIVVVIDYKRNRNLILDGNHRVNTYAKDMPDKYVKVIIKYAPVLDGMI